MLAYHLARLGLAMGEDAMRPFGRKERIVFAIAAAVPLVVVVGVQGPTGPSPAMAMARVCFNLVSATGHGKLQAGATNSARVNWNQMVGNSYNSFGNSDGQDTTCRHDGRPPILRQWTCIATARRCQGSGSSSGGSSSGGSSSGGGLPLCHNSFAVEGAQALLQPGAENNAVSAWQQTANNNHGPAYQAWGRAQGRDVACRHNGLGPIQRRWRCIATGTPCRQP